MEGDNKPAKHKIVQTYAEDMAHALEDGKGGVIKKIIHGAEEQEAQKRNLSPESRKNKLYMMLGMFLVLVSFATLSSFLIGRKAPSIPVEEQFVPLIYTDKNYLVEVTGLKKNEIQNRIFKKVNGTTVKDGGIEGIYLAVNKSPVGLRKFIELIEGNFDVSNNFLDDNFLTGAFKGKEENNFFILLKMRSMADVFDNMRAWEAKMFTDLHGFFGVPLSPETKYLITAEFENGIVENKNARILYAKEEPLEEGQTASPVGTEPRERKIVMMYVFADDNSIIITDSRDATREVILRLASSQIKK